MRRGGTILDISDAFLVSVGASCALRDALDASEANAVRGAMGLMGKMREILGIPIGIRRAETPIGTRKLPELPLTDFLAAGIYPALFYRTLEHMANGLSSRTVRGWGLRPSGPTWDKLPGRIDLSE